MDMLREECLECGLGMYVEKSIHCDWSGEPLNCDVCDHSMPRYPEAVKASVAQSE